MAWERETGAQRCRVCRVPGQYGGWHTGGESGTFQLYSGAGEAGIVWGEKSAAAATRGRVGEWGAWGMVLVAGTEAVLRPAQPRKLEIEGGDGFAPGSGG